MPLEKFQIIGRYPVNHVPKLEILKTLATKNWGEKMGGIEPSFIPKEGDRILLLAQQPGVTIHSHDVIDLVEKSKTLFHANVYGLLIFRQIFRGDKNILSGFKESVWVLGMDNLHKKHLSFQKGFGHTLPYMHIDSNGRIKYGGHPYQFRVEEDELVIVFERN